MRQFVVTPPASWKSTGHGTYAIGEATLSVGELGPLPEDPRAYASQQVGLPAEQLETRKLPAGWPVLVAVTPERILLLVRVLDRGVIVRLEGPAAAVLAARTSVLEALDAAKLEWDERPFYTLAELLEGV
jgi:hypothetical protein